MSNANTAPTQGPSSNAAVAPSAAATPDPARITQTPTSSVASVAPETQGSVSTSLQTSGNPSVQPFPTRVISSPSSAIDPATLSVTTIVESTTTEGVSAAAPTPPNSSASGSAPAAALSSTTTLTISSSSSFVASSASSGISSVITVAQGAATPSSSPTGSASQDVFNPISTGGIPSNIGSRGDHPVARLGINQNTPIETNKFYANFFLGSQTSPSFTHPYSVAWNKGAPSTGSWGLSVSHIDADQRVYGPQQSNIPGNPVKYYVNPLGIQSLIFSATELGGSTVLTTDSLQGASVNVNLSPSASTAKRQSAGKITFPLVQGMGFITAIYSGLQPVLQSGVFFQSVVSTGTVQTGVYKYRITLQDGKNWLLYVAPSNGVDPKMTLVDNMHLQGPSGFNGYIQVAKNPSGTDGEAVYDRSAGVYATSAEVSGFTSGTTGTYTHSWTKAGLTNLPLVMFALPHHMQSLSLSTLGSSTNVKLQTTTKGLGTAIVADLWTLVESNLPLDMAFAPWRPTTGSVNSLSATAVQLIHNVAQSEVSEDMNKQTALDSMYFSGKALAKYAQIVYVIHDLAQDDTLAAAGLVKLKNAFSLFVNNQQQYPLVYDTAWKGVVSTGSFATGDSGQDFGNTYYNDHHFHYGYFVYTAAVIGYLDSSWIASNRDWVNMLLRDAANPSTADTMFPFSRSFDWYHGHSFAKGLFESSDSKDEESSSEDAMFAYAMKMWGKIVADPSMEARGNLMLSILARSLQNYFLMESNNTVQPANFIANKATGVLFENKVQHTTYFGDNLEFIEGIHMIPLIPSSTLTRTTNFVTEEWNAYFTDTAVVPASGLQGGWKGILYANLAIINPKASWNFFAASNFDVTSLDGGASRTWYLAYAAGLGGA
ncbi:endo-1,3-beta-glucanase [Cryomyces antarcticus]